MTDALTKSSLEGALGVSLKEEEGTWRLVGSVPLAKLKEGVEALGLGEFIDDLPSPVQEVFKDVTITSLTFTPSATDPALSFSVAIASFGIGPLTIGASTIGLSWSASRGLAGSLSASQITFGGADFTMAVSAELPSLLFVAELGEGGASDEAGKAALDSHGLSGSDPNDAPRLDDLAIRAALREPRVIVHLAVSNLFHIEGLTMRQAQIDLTYAAGAGSVFTFLGWTIVEIPVAAAGDQPGGLLELLVRAEKTSDGYAFRGGMVPGTEVALGRVIAGLGRSEEHLPEVLGGLMLTSLGLSYAKDSKKSEFTFTFGVSLEVAGELLAVSIFADVISATGSGRTLKLRGTVQFGPETIELDFTAMSAANGMSAKDVLIAGFTTQRTLDLGEVLSAVPPLGDALEGIDVELKGADFMMIAEAPKPKRYLFGLDLSITPIDLTGLPAIGSILPSPIGVDDLCFILTSAPFTVADVPELPALLQPLAEVPSGASPTAPVFSSGFNFRAGLSVGAEKIVFPRAAAAASPTSAASYPGGAASPPPPTSAPAATPLPSDGATWIELGKTLGPVTLDKIGGMYAQGAVWLLLAASFKVGVLTLTVDGLGVGVTVPPSWPPKFRIRGLALTYQSGPLELSGGFVADDAMDTFAGEAVLKAEVLTISAIGEYSHKDGTTSAFVFAMLDAPLGGPGVFFVTGIAAGFGYNSSVKLPTIDRVKQHVLVEAALPGQTSTGLAEAQSRGPGEVLAKLTMSGDVSPRVGEIWLAAGVRFSSFDLIDTFALLVVEFGRVLEIAVLGISKISLPPPPEPGAEAPTPFALVELALEVKILPEEGEFSATALITPASFLLDPQCKPTGGFALYVWWSPSPHAGEFVLTIGGYHPRFQPKPYYPQVPRLGFHWPLSDVLTIDGSAYFALTPSAVMAGGRLSALFHLGPIRAWFIAFLDALIEWAPFHFDVDIGISIGVSVRIHVLFVTVTITVELGCQLSLWGPRLAGVAHISFYIISFSIPIGDTSGRDKPRRLDWKDFAATLLPPPDQILSAAIVDGLAARQPAPGSGDPAIVRADHVSLAIQSAIPATRIVAGTTLEGLASVPVRPMGETLSDTTLTVTVTSGDDTGADRTAHFDATPIVGRAPAAKWGEYASIVQDGIQLADADQMIEGVVTGVTLTVKPPLAPTPSGADLLKLDVAAALVHHVVDPEATYTADDLVAAPANAAPTPVTDPQWPRTISTAIDASAPTRAGIVAALKNITALPKDEERYAGHPERWVRGAPLKIGA
ncbi:MAG: DUF6603 domain-containing protein [Nannocystaceae bacterium]